jgi:hypothetical protein
MLSPTAFACDRAESDQPHDRDSKSIDCIAGSKRYNPYQQVEHGTHRAASHKQRARHLFQPYSQTPRSKRACSRCAATRTRKPADDRMQRFQHLGAPKKEQGGTEEKAAEVGLTIVISMRHPDAGARQNSDAVAPPMNVRAVLWDLDNWSVMRLPVAALKVASTENASLKAL